MKRFYFGLSLSVFCLLAPAQDIPAAQDRDADRDDDPAARLEWFYQERAYPLGHIPTGARLNAIRRLEELDRAARARGVSARTGVAGVASQPSAGPANWTLIGPRPTDEGSTYVTAGRVNAIAIDPRDSNVVYIGAAEGGIWKSVDGGAAWNALTDAQPSLSSGALALDPSNPDIVYAGTGEENFAYDSYYGAGILKSTDGGATWTNLASDVFLRSRIGKLAIHPKGQILLCTTDTGVWRSSDGAATWSRVLSGAPGTAALFDPANPETAYAALGSPGGNGKNGVYRSTDAGLTWSPAMGSGANALPTANVGRIEIAIAPSSTNVLYAAIQNSDSNNFGVFLGLFKSVDAGATWNQLSSAPASLCAKQCWFDMTIAVHPSNPDIVFGGGFLIARSLDGGATWTSLPSIGPNRTELHVDQHVLAFTPDATKLYIGNDGGMWSSVDISSDRVNWTNLNSTLALTQFSPGLSVHPTDPNVAFGGAQDNGTQRYNGKLSWNGVTCGDGGWSAIDGASPAVILAACQNIDIRRTADGGGHWLRSRYGINQGDRTQFISPLVGDPGNSQNFYFGTFRLWRTTDGGGKWSAISPDLSAGRGTIKTVALAAADPNVIYVGLSDGRVQVTANAGDAGGVNWTDASSGLPPRVVTNIAVDPVDPATAYLAFSGFSMGADTQGHVFRTNDRGASWLDISGNLPNMPVNGVVVDADLPDTLYIATDAGVMVTSDAGQTWSSLGAGLPRVVVTSLAFQRSTRTLLAGTHGRSVWNILVPLSSPSLAPVIAAVTPNSANAGGSAFSLEIAGSNFAPGTVVRWNGRDLPTSVIDNKHATVQVAAGDIAHVGRSTLIAFSPMRGAGASNPAAFQIGPAPLSTPDAFVSAANPLGGSALSPGSIGTLFGVNLAGASVQADAAPPLPSYLGGTSLAIVGSPAPLFYVSPGQINFQVPFATVSAPLQVPLTIVQGALSTTITVTLKPYSPALFTANSGGTGQASASIAGTGTIAAPSGAFPGSRPAQRGEFVSLFGTGLGAVRNGPASGSPSPVEPLAATVATPTVTIGGQPAQVTFSGLAPGFVGLYQVNVKVPAAAPSGSAVPVSLSIGGETSNTATIAIQ